MFEFVIDKQQHETKEIELKELYDILIIGGGPAAINAAIYGARKGLTTLLVGKDSGGQLLNTNTIDNYLGFHNISGEELNSHYVNHLDNFEVDKLFKTEVNTLKKEKGLFIANLSNNKEVKSKTVIIATGGSPRRLNVLGEEGLIGKGVSFCSICDGDFYKDKDLLVVGGGNSAIEAAIDLSKIARKITIVEIAKNFTGDKILIDQLKTLKNVVMISDTKTTEIIGSDHVEAVILNKNNSEETQKLEVDGIFIEIGVIPNNALVKDLVEVNKVGEIIVDIHQQTSVPGLYAAGDVSNFPYKQVITAASQGAVAALTANNYINEMER